MIILGTNSIKDTGGFSVDNSCRFDGSSSYLTKTGSSGNRKVFTFSTWLKRSTLTAGAEQIIGQSSETSGNDTFRILFDAGGTPDQIRVFSSNGNMNKIPRMKFLDNSAWYHIVMAFDTTQSTAADRNKIYVNGNLITDFSTSVDVDINTSFEFNIPNEHTIGRNGYTNTEFFGGYMAETVLIDGTQYAASDFGEFDEDSGIWKPIDVSGLTFGTNGFYLDFKASGNLGNDANGGTDLTEAGLAAVDQSTDTCTNNFCTLSPLWNSFNQGTLSEGNLKSSMTSGAYKTNLASFGVSQGKWYWEIKVTQASNVNFLNFGVTDESTNKNIDFKALAGTTLYNNTTGKISIDGSEDGSAAAKFAVGDIVGIALNMDDKEISFLKNGSALFSDVDMSSTSNLVFPFHIAYTYATYIFEYNFGGTQSFAISSGNTDGDGYGNFEYAVPRWLICALCTAKNLAEVLG